MSFYDAIRVGASGAADFEVERSLRFNDNDTAYLSRTPSSAGDRKKWTFSAWIKRGNLGGSAGEQRIFGGNGNASHIYFPSNDEITWDLATGSGSVSGNLNTTQVFRDPSAWFHLVCALDTDESTADNRMRMYINGTEVTSFGSRTNPSSGYATNEINNNTLHTIGYRTSGQGSAGMEFDGYMAEVNFIDGQQLTPSSFGKTNSATGQWVPIDTSGLTFGTNGFRLNFANNDLFTNFTDSSSSARTVTRNGNVIHTQDQKKNGASSIYFDGSGDSITVPDSSDFHVAGNDFTIEAYVRRTSQGNDEWFFVQTEGTTSNTSIGLHIGSSSSGYANLPSLRYTVGGSGNELQGTTALAANTWYHIAGVRDGNTLRIYVNGVQENSTSFSGTITDATTPVIMGAVNSAGSAGLTGYLDQLRWSNSCRYPDGTTFTAPTTQFTADSNTKLLVQSNVTGDVGSDSSGNGNNFTPNNFSVAAGEGNDSLEDTPTNNFATMNPLVPSPSATWANGNLDLAGTSSSQYSQNNTSTFGVSSGKWYVEVKYTNDGTTNTYVGICPITTSATTNLTNNVTDGAVLRMDNTLFIEGSSPSSGTSISSGDIIGIALDMDNQKVWFSVQGTYLSSGNPSTGANATFDGITAGETIAICARPLSGTLNFNFGQRAFTYTPPTGFKKLNSANLPDPTIKLPDKHFDTLLWSGNSTNNRSITGLEFQPDWVWIKARTVSVMTHWIVDALRPNTDNGTGNGNVGALASNSTDGEQAHPDGGFESFDANGFTLGKGSNDNNADSAYQRMNASGRTYVGWNWNAGESDSATYRVVVVSDSGNKYRFRNSANTATFAQSAVTLDLAEGGTYIFNMDDATNATHPFSIGTAANGTVYTSGITYFLDGVSKTYSEYTSGFSSASTRRLHITVPASAPVLYYWCSAHSGMGGQINTNSTLGSSNFDGSIQSRTKVNATAGFSIVTYTGNGTGGATIGHGLGVAPNWIIAKVRNASRSWAVGSDDSPWSLNLRLDENSGTANTSQSKNQWYETAPTSTKFYVGDGDVGDYSGDTNVNGENYVAYCFSEVAGYSKFGKYTGNGSSDGTFIFTGFRPAWFVVKRTDTANNWRTFDAKRSPFNEVDKRIYLDTTNAESTGSDIDFLSNGVKMRMTDNGMNASGGTYLFFAFAESPFKNSRAR